MKTTFQKIFFLFTATVALSSCSSDDDPVVYPQPVIVPESVVLQEGSTTRTYTFEYDGQRRISKYNLSAGSESYQATLEYNADNQVSRVQFSGALTSLVEFGYTNGRLSSGTLDGTAYPIAYDNATEIYNLDDLLFSMNDNGDLSMFDGTEISYADKKGPMANLGPNYHFLMIMEDTFVAYCFSKKAINGLPDVTVQNTYDDQGMIKSAIIDNFSIAYNYKQIL